MVKFKHADSTSGLRCLAVKAIASESIGRMFESRCGQEEFFIL